jgi:SanA protein
MYNYLVNVSGIAAGDVMRDFGGRRTFDTCIRAKEVFGVSEAVLISQEYHLSRAIFTCEGVGVESVGFSATRQPYVLDKYFRLRELAAVYKAFLDVCVWEPEYVL